MYALVLCGAALCAWRVAELMRATVHHQAFTEQMVRLVEVGNLQRARKLAEVAEATAYGAMLRAVLADAAELDGKSRDPAALVGGLEATFDRAHREEMARLSRGQWRTWSGGLSAAVGAGLALTSSPMEAALLAIAGAALLGSIWSSVAFMRIDRGSQEGMARLGPVLAEHLAPKDADEPSSHSGNGRPAEAKESDEGKEPGLVFRVHEPNKEPRTVVLDQPVIKIGKLSGSHLRLADDEASRMHAVIEVSEDGRVVIIDLGSLLGTWVDGERVTKAELQPGCEIRIADTRIELVSIR